MISLKSLCNEYFINFNNKNLEKLSELFSDDISLTDWNISVKGKENVLKEISNIFSNVQNIKISIYGDLYEDKNTVCCEIEIILNNYTANYEILKVVDIITFNDYGKIEKINAYKQ